MEQSDKRGERKKFQTPKSRAKSNLYFVIEDGQVHWKWIRKLIIVPSLFQINSPNHPPHSLALHKPWNPFPMRKGFANLHAINIQSKRKCQHQSDELVSRSNSELSVYRPVSMDGNTLWRSRPQLGETRFGPWLSVCLWWQRELFSTITLG